jgi:diguanylate cyclase (GGDEF)-like protein
MWRDRLLADLLLHDSVERDADLQARVDSARTPWLMRRGLLLAVGFAVVLGLIGLLPPLLIWQVSFLLGTIISESEIYLARHARTTSAFDLRMLVARIAIVASVGLAVPLVVGSIWAVPMTLAVILAVSATQLRKHPLLGLMAVGSTTYLTGTLLVTTGTVEPVDPAGLSGIISAPAAVAIALIALPTVTVFVWARAQRADQSRVDLEHTVVELREAQERLRASQRQAEGVSERLTAEVERKTEELARRNRALSIVNAISFALNEPFEDDAALRRAAQLVARLLAVDAVQIRELTADGSSGAEIVEGVGAESDERPRLPAEVLDAAIDLREGVTRSVDGESEGDLCYVIVPMVTQATVRGSLTLIGEACREWGEQELHLLTLIGREMGAALESARLYRAALALADRELLVTDASSLLAGGAPLHEQLDELLVKVGEGFGGVFASVTSVESGAVGPELARWETSDDRPLTAEELNALTSLVPTDLSSAGVPQVLAAEPEGSGPDLPAIRQRFGDIVIAPILTAQTDPEAATGRVSAPDHEHAQRLPAGVVMLAAPANAGWPSADIEVLARLASAIGRRLEGEQLVQFQHRRFEELAALAEIARVTQAGTDADRLYGEFAIALHRLLPYERAFVVRTSDDAVTEVIGFTETGRSRESVVFDASDTSHPWFNARETITWSRDDAALPAFLGENVSRGLTLPMRPKGQSLGAVILLARDGQPLSARLAERAVDQLAIALDSAELYRQATERASRIEAHKNLASIVASAIDLRGAFDAFAEEIRWLIPFERAVMLTIGEGDRGVEQLAIYPPVADGELISAPLEDSIMKRVLESDGAIALPRSDERLAALDWSLVGDDAAEIAAVPVMQGRDATAIFALVNSGVADYEQFDLRALEEVAGLLAVTIDRLRLYERAEHAARHDLLTGLPNYRFLQERLATLRTEFEDGHSSAVLMVDMDGLKLYNDTLGHEAGDRAIQRVAEELSLAVRADDLVARTGGDEFVVVMEDVSQDDALVVAQRMHDSLRDIHREFGNAPVPVRISVGLAFAPDDGTGASELLEAADRAMYAAKFGGGDRTRAAGGDHETGNAPRTLRRRGNRVMELLIRTAVDGASGSERLAVALAQRYVVAVALGRGLPVDTADPLRMLVAAEAAHHIEAPEEYRDQETALMLLDGLRTQWDERMSAVDLKIGELLPAAVRLAWEQIPAPDGPGLAAEQALSIVTNDPAYHLSPEVLELLTQSALTAEFERRRSRGDAA